MPNMAAHSIIGTLAGGGLEYFTSKDGTPDDLPRRVLIGALGGLIGSAIADEVDPPTSYRHRGPGHSLLLGIGAGLLLFYAAGRLNGGERSLGEGPQKEVEQAPSVCMWASFLRGVAAGHFSHLALDAYTPMGLPL